MVSYDCTPAKACTIQLTVFKTYDEQTQLDVLVDLCKQCLRDHMEFLRHLLCLFEHIIMNVVGTEYAFEEWLHTNYDWDFFSFGT